MTERGRTRSVSIAESRLALSLQEKIESSVIPEPIQQAMRKDLHVVVAAGLDDQRIISNDGKARRYFASLTDQSARDALYGILWVVPSNPEHTVMAWIEAGTPDEPKKRLIRDDDERGESTCGQ